MRIVGLDFGTRRIGVAISDATRTLARPLGAIDASAGEPAACVANEIARLAGEEDGVARVVIGLPHRLDGSPNDMTARVVEFAEALRARVTVPVVLQDERLSSHEAESRLALREKSWRARKAKLDAAAAAVILQDYLDSVRDVD